MQRGARKIPTNASLLPPQRRQPVQHAQHAQHAQPVQTTQPLSSDNSINKLYSEITALKSHINFLNSRIDELQHTIIKQKFLDTKIYENTIMIAKVVEELSGLSKKVIDIKHQDTTVDNNILPIKNINSLFSEPKEEPKEEPKILKSLKYKLLQE